VKVADIEIPYPEERGFVYRLFEILPGVLSWTIIFSPVILSFFWPSLAAYVLTTYIVIWFIRSMTMSFRTLQSYKIMQQHQILDWQQLIDDLMSPDEALERIGSLEGKYPLPWHVANIHTYVDSHPGDSLTAHNLVHAIVIPFHREGREILQPSLEALAQASYNMKDVIVVLTAEERAGPEAGVLARQLAKEFKSTFRAVIATVHPKDIPGEIKGKGPNSNWGMKALSDYIGKEKIPTKNVLVTSLDCDHRIHHNYLNALTYYYLICPDRMYTSFQPISMFTNNIWDVPAPMCVAQTTHTA
jgi:hypothetical protein